MPRALTVKRTVVPKSGRAEYMKRLRDRQAYYERAGCKLLVFEEAGLPGAFIEFTEGPNAAVLSAAHERSPEQLLDANRIYQEVELR